MQNNVFELANFSESIVTYLNIEGLNRDYQRTPLIQVEKTSAYQESATCLVGRRHGSSRAFSIVSDLAFKRGS
jgi:hypothetical protein